MDNETLFFATDLAESNASALKERLLYECRDTMNALADAGGNMPRKQKEALALHMARTRCILTALAGIIGIQAEVTDLEKRCTTEADAYWRKYVAAPKHATECANMA